MSKENSLEKPSQLYSSRIDEGILQRTENFFLRFFVAEKFPLMLTDALIADNRTFRVQIDNIQHFVRVEIFQVSVAAQNREKRHQQIEQCLIGSVRSSTSKALRLWQSSPIGMKQKLCYEATDNWQTRLSLGRLYAIHSKVYHNALI